MSEPMTAYLIVGGMVAVACLLPATWAAADARSRYLAPFEKRHQADTARLALKWLGLAVLAPLLWPALLAAALVRGLWWLIRTAYPKEPR